MLCLIEVKIVSSKLCVKISLSAVLVVSKKITGILPVIEECCIRIFA